MLRLVSRTLFAVAASVVALMVATAAPALAHNELKSSNPADGATMATTPAAVTLTFNDILDADHTEVTVTGPGGTPAAAGKPRITDDTATLDLTPGPAGVYTINYSTVAHDGHKGGGTTRFTVTAGVTPAATPTSSSVAPAPPAPTSTTAMQAAPTSTSIGWMPWAIGAAVVVIVIAAAAIAVGRRGRADS